MFLLDRGKRVLGSIRNVAVCLFASYSTFSMLMLMLKIIIASFLDSSPVQVPRQSIISPSSKTRMNGSSNLSRSLCRFRGLSS